MQKEDTIVEQFIKKMEVSKNLSSLTIKAYVSDLNDYMRFYGELNTSKEAMIDYIEHLRSKRCLKDTSIKRKIVTLNIFFNYLVEELLLENNPIDKLKFQFKKERRLPKTLSVKEVTSILKVIERKLGNFKSKFSYMQNVRDAAILDLLISTGVRICEIASLKLEDVFHNERIILIHGKGRKQRLIYISAPETWQRLKEWIRVRNSDKSIKHNHVFINRYGNQISICTIEEIFYKYRKLAKINAKSTPHYLRHTFATNLLANGADIRVVQELLGHSSISTTEIYTEVTNKRKIKALQKYNYRNKIMSERIQD